ncbi:DinB family protein [Deinococcus planocerae]|uniref:DinB family protein n=1 Tax=Deinococcus planocerae TaxID=1737569 RepID=UPI000C7F4A78|nr:DinB family protein [Deinococcus planocerae]
MTTKTTGAADAALRNHIRALLTERQAHVLLDDVLEGFPPGRINDRPEGVPYSAWEVLWHLRFTQRDILDFVRDEGYVEPEWPAGYWPDNTREATPEDWHAEARTFQEDLAALLTLLDDPSTDLLAVVPNGAKPGGGGQTWLREFLLVADHNAYHVGQLMLLKRLLGGG